MYGKITNTWIGSEAGQCAGMYFGVYPSDPDLQRYFHSQKNENEKMRNSR